MGSRVLHALLAAALAALAIAVLGRGPLDRGSDGAERDHAAVTHVTFGHSVPAALRPVALQLIAEVDAYWEREAAITLPPAHIAIGVNFEVDLAPIYADWEEQSIESSVEEWRSQRWAGYTSWYRDDEDHDEASPHIYVHAPRELWRAGAGHGSTLEAILVHEYFHQVQAVLDPAASAGGVPDWLLEGSARYAEYRHFLSEGADVSELESRFSRPDDAELEELRTCATGACHQADVYWTGAAAVAWLNERSRPTAYIDFWRERGRSGNWRDAFARTYGLAVETFYQEFAEFQAGRRMARAVIVNGTLSVDGLPPPPGKWVVQACYTNLIRDCVAVPVGPDGRYELRVAPRWLDGHDAESATITASARTGCTIFPVAPLSVGPPAGGGMSIWLDGGAEQRDFEIDSEGLRCLARG